MVVQRTTDVVVVLPALRGLTNISAAADAAAKQPTEKVCAPDDSRPLLFRCTGLECLLDLTEGPTGNDGWPCVFGADGIGLLSYTAGASPNRCARVDLIAEDVADARLEPSLSAVRDSAAVEFHADFLESVAAQRHAEHLFDDSGGRGINFQRRVLAIAVLDLDPVVPERSTTGQVVSTRGSLPHAPSHLLGKVFGVELVDALDDSFHEFAGRGVIGVLRNRNDADALAAEHGLECNGVLAFAREAGELPDENLLEGSVGSGRSV